MSLNHRLARLEQHFGADDAEPCLDDLVREDMALTDWLASIGMSAEQALAAGLEPPASLGLRWATLSDAVEADAELAAWEHVPAGV